MKFGAKEDGVFVKEDVNGSGVGKSVFVVVEAAVVELCVVLICVVSLSAISVH